MVGIKLDFCISEEYLIIHTLSHTNKSQFSSNKNKKDIVAFQNFAWSKSIDSYNLLAGRYYPSTKTSGIKSTVSKIEYYIETLKKSKQYLKILSQTRSYLEYCKEQWENNYVKTASVMKSLTGLNLDGSFVVYITHPSLMNGTNAGNNIICWGHNEDWPNYTTVYLWHEIMHSYMGHDDTSHALIELITDEELRVRLNGGRYPPLIRGHPHLERIEKKLLPAWKRYLKSDKHDIIKFRASIKPRL